MTARSDLIIESEWLEAGRVKTDGVVGGVKSAEGVKVKEKWNKERNVKVTSVQIRTKEASGNWSGRWGHILHWKFRN